MKIVETEVPLTTTDSRLSPVRHDLLPSPREVNPLDGLTLRDTERRLPHRLFVQVLRDEVLGGV